VRTLGADGTVLTTTYRSLRALNPARHVTLPDGAAASTLYSDRRPIGPGSEVASFDPSQPPPAIAPGVGKGSIQTRGGQPGLRFPTRPWAVRTVETLQTGTNGPDIDAVLRWVGGSKTSPSRVTGTVTNRGHQPLHRLQAQSTGGQARLPAILAPGETAQVDAPLLPITTGPPPDGKLTPPQPEETTMFAASSRAFTGPGQIAIAASTDPKAPSQEADRIAVV